MGPDGLDGNEAIPEGRGLSVGGGIAFRRDRHTGALGVEAVGSEPRDERFPFLAGVDDLAVGADDGITRAGIVGRHGKRRRAVVKQRPAGRRREQQDGKADRRADPRGVQVLGVLVGEHPRIRQIVVDLQFVRLP